MQRLLIICYLTSIVYCSYLASLNPVKPLTQIQAGFVGVGWDYPTIEVELNFLDEDNSPSDYALTITASPSGCAPVPETTISPLETGVYRTELTAPTVSGPCTLFFSYANNELEPYNITMYAFDLDAMSFPAVQYENVTIIVERCQVPKDRFLHDDLPLILICSLSALGILGTCLYFL
jgi:hypothetical protein